MANTQRFLAFEFWLSIIHPLLFVGGFSLAYYETYVYIYSIRGQFKMGVDCELIYPL